MKKTKKDRRKPVTCSNCGHEMVCMNRFQTIFQMVRGFYVWYVCPRRKDEDGCGHSVIYRIAKRKKRLGRIVGKGKKK